MVREEASTGTQKVFKNNREIDFDNIWIKENLIETKGFQNIDKLQSNYQNCDKYLKLLKKLLIRSHGALNS
jgi:hypothetical protein